VSCDAIPIVAFFPHRGEYLGNCPRRGRLDARSEVRGQIAEVIAEVRGQISEVRTLRWIGFYLCNLTSDLCNPPLTSSTRRPFTRTISLPDCPMLYRKTQFLRRASVALAFALFVAPTLTLAQHGGVAVESTRHTPAPAAAVLRESAKKTISRTSIAFLALQATAISAPPSSRSRNPSRKPPINCKPFANLCESACFFRPLRARNRRQSSPRKGSRRQPEIPGLVLSRARIRFERPHEETGKSRFRPRQTSQELRSSSPCAKPESEQLADAAALEKPWPASRPSTSRWARK